MQVQALTQADMEQIRAIWKDCFHDSDAFLDSYFESVVDVTDGIGFFDNGKLVSNLFEVTMNANISGMVYQTEFISGCATLPQARNQHLMRELIRTALTDMRARDVAVAFLHPFLHSFYRKYGFETVNYVQKLTAQPADSADSKVRIVSRMQDMPVDAAYASYQAYVTQYGSYFMRSESRMNGWLELLFADGGKAAFIDGQDNTPYALFYPGTNENGESVNDIFELVFFSDEQLQLLTENTGAAATYLLPAGPASGDAAAEYTMMRIVSPEIMLQSYSYAPGTEPFVINIHDPFLSRDYNLEIMPQKTGSATVREVESASNIIVDVSDLARLFTGTYRPEEYPGAVKTFRVGSSCFFDNY